MGGFTFIDMYTCYASATDVDNLVGTTAGSAQAVFERLDMDVRSPGLHGIRDQLIHEADQRE